MRRIVDASVEIEPLVTGKYGYCGLSDGWCFTKDNSYVMIVRNFLKSSYPSNIIFYK